MERKALVAGSVVALVALVALSQPQPLSSSRVSIWRYGAENSAKKKFTAPRALFAAPEIKKYSALARAGLVRTCSDDGECSERHAARVHVRHCSMTSERGQVLFVSALTGRLGQHNSMRMRAAPRTIVAPFSPRKLYFQHPCESYCAGVERKALVALVV